MAEQRRAERRRTVRNRAIVGVVVAAVVVLVVVRNLNNRQEGQRVVAQLTAGSCESDRRSDGGSSHVASPAYRVDPPSGGDHSPSAASAGTYSEGDAPQDGEIVHAMEHGYVILWHRPDVGEAQQEILDDIATRFERDVLLVPRSSLEKPVAATAWHRRLLCEEVERDTLTSFVRQYANNGPEKIPH